MNSPGFPITRIINLECDIAKRARSTANIARYTDNYSFFSAIVGNQLDESEITLQYDVRKNSLYAKRPMSKPEIGCYLSHIAMWSEIAIGKEDCVLVLEDDFEFIRDPKPFFQCIAKLDLRDVMIKIDSEKARGTVRFRKIAGEFELLANSIIGPRTTGYVIGKYAAQKLVKCKQRFFRPVDNDLKHLWEHGVPILTSQPSLVSEVAEATAESSIKDMRKLAKSENPLRRAYLNLRYQYHFRIGNFKYQLEPVSLRDNIGS